MGLISGIINDAISEVYCFGVDHFGNSYLGTAYAEEVEEKEEQKEQELDMSVRPSANMDLYNIELKDVEDQYNKDYATANARRYRTRAYTGLIVCAHVINFLEGKETLRKNWDIHNQEAANVVSNHLGYCKLYEVGDDYDEDFSHYGFNDHLKHPIITEDILNKALELFPLSEETVKLSAKYDKKTGKIDEVTESVEDEVPFDDSTVEVMDVEEDVIAASKSKSKKAKEETTSVAVVQDPDVIAVAVEEDKPSKSSVSPIVDELGNKYLNVNSNEIQDLTENQIKAFNENFGQYLHGKDAELHRMRSGAIECVIKDPTGAYSRWIDPGLCIGDGWNVLGNIMTGNPSYPLDTIPVNYQDGDILEKVFQIKNYVLTPEEVQRCNARMFSNQRIYSIVDMSTMNARLAKMNPEEFKKFETKLTFVIDQLKPEEVGRFRIYKWKNQDNFRMISDEKAISPFPGQTLYNITGVDIYVNGNNVLITGVDGTERSSSMKGTAA